MDANNTQLTELLDRTDSAFKQLMQDPNSSECSHAYENAKQELDYFLFNMRDELKKKYRNF
ncbi:hypothetical protein [Aliiglaciecola litoralis]|uniref:Uncharacterized protein n=1 Tax=Aliiglaciecola litoralis TaxID=582857 RepID=A0ABN1LSN5_9ALTE